MNSKLKRNCIRQCSAFMFLSHMFEAVASENVNVKFEKIFDYFERGYKANNFLNT